ncbi:class I SAM-dependent methyltransferase [Asticcacaulis machinosus]|uniref:Methyltransferase n=1 Tax=Asticcacaulis machinosus TaxID=2984211 RepID=A0ABT5HJF2_9CAUL|nr:methyltransferase [Asticcacaulis machinosus]MDC7675729.1 methyltransferase [Asticcacaulis machinosus]
MYDPVLDTLVLPLNDGLIDLPADGKALFLRARSGLALRDYREQLICEQSFKPALDALTQQGFIARPEGDEARYALTLVLPPRQREEYRALLARAVTSTADGGTVMASVSNLEGAKTVENDLKALTGDISSLSKNKCRVFWAKIKASSLNGDLIEAWSKLDAVRPIEGGRFLSRPGLFAWDRIDAGSRRLVETLPPLTGKGADLGAGFGYLTAEIFARHAGVTHISLYEAEQRAVDLARQNLTDRSVDVHWHDVTSGINGEFDFIVSNPPFHIDRADKHDLGKAFIRAAASALKPKGAFYMVANRHLPYEDTLKTAFKVVKILADDGAYKVFEASTQSEASVKKKPRKHETTEPKNAAFKGETLRRRS